MKAVLIGTILLSALVLSACSSGTPTSSNQPTSSPTEVSQLNYENRPTVENYAFLFTGTDKSESHLKEVLQQIKEEKCKKQCNVDLYDDKQAYELDKQYRDLGSLEEMTEWKNKNYVFVADHLVGDIMFDEFSYYPMKDSFYEEKKQQKQ